MFWAAPKPLVNLTARTAVMVSCELRRSFYCWRAACKQRRGHQVNMSVAVIPMAKELGWSATDRGLVSSAFFWGCALLGALGLAVVICHRLDVAAVALQLMSPACFWGRFYGRVAWRSCPNESLPAMSRNLA